MKTTYSVEDQGAGEIFGGVVQLDADHFLVTFREHSTRLYFWIMAHATQQIGDSLFFTWDDIKRVRLQTEQDNRFSDPLFVDWIRVGLSLPTPDEYDQYMKPGEEGSHVEAVNKLDEYIDNHPEPMLRYTPRSGGQGELNEHLINDYLTTQGQRVKFLRAARKVLDDFLRGRPKPGAPKGNKNRQEEVPAWILEEVRQRTYKDRTTGISYTNVNMFALAVRFSPKTIQRELKRQQQD